MSSPIWREYNRDNLEAQEDDAFSFPGYVPRIKSWLASWHRSLDAAPQVSILLDITNDRPSLHLQAVALLFGLGGTHAQQWPGIYVTCLRLEVKFVVLLHDEFDIVWRILGRSKPLEAFECWHWFFAVLRTLRALEAHERLSMEDVYNHLMEGTSAECNSSEKNHALLAIFAVLCWASMTLNPVLKDQTTLLAPGGHQQLSFHAEGMAKINKLAEKPMRDTARRPITKVFRAVKGALDESGHFGTAAEVMNTGTLYESSLTFFSLYTMGGVQVKWVEDLTSHLSFDRQYRTLSVFSQPSYCVSSIVEKQEIIVLQQVTSELLLRRPNVDEVDRDPSSLHREVLLSYRLLFGQSSQSRKLSLKLLAQLETASGEVDPFLRTICSTPLKKSHFLHLFFRSKIPHNIFPPSNLDLNGSLIESDTYSSQDDFPYFGSRLLEVQQFNLRQQPSRVRDLWRDRRNPLQWYTFWAVLWVGGITIFLSVCQLIAGILQTYYSAP